MRLLLVEDNPSLCSVIADVLREEGYEVDIADHGEKGLILAKQNIYDALILDIMLPGLDGIDIVKRLRSKSILTKVIFLTAKDSVSDRVKGLDAGANDYLIKPFAIEELLARLRVLLRNNEQDDSLTCGPISINSKLHAAYFKNEDLSLTIKEFQLLEYLMMNQKQILIRDQIFNRIWGLESDVGSGVVDVYVHHLRKKLAQYDVDNMIITVRGIGYIIKGD